MIFKKLYKVMVLSAILITITGCGANYWKIPEGLYGWIIPDNAEEAQGTKETLGDWVDKTVGPQLSKTMSEHPRFKNKTIGEHPSFKNQLFLIGTVCNGKICPVKDNTTQKIRQCLRKHLLNNGVDIPRRPQKDWDDLSDPGGLRLEKISYYIVIDSRLDPSEELLKVNIEIFSVDENESIGGHDGSYKTQWAWEGEPTEQESQAIRQKCIEKNEVKYSNIEIEDDSLKEIISIKDPEEIAPELGMKKMKVTGKNWGVSDIVFEYKIKFFDEKGRNLSEIKSSWKAKPVKAYSKYSFTFLVPTKTAKDYKVFIREKRLD